MGGWQSSESTPWLLALWLVGVAKAAGTSGGGGDGTCCRRHASGGCIPHLNCNCESLNPFSGIHQPDMPAHMPMARWLKTA